MIGSIVVVSLPTTDKTERRQRLVIDRWCQGAIPFRWGNIAASARACLPRTTLSISPTGSSRMETERDERLFRNRQINHINVVSRNGYGTVVYKKGVTLKRKTMTSNVR